MKKIFFLFITLSLLFSCATKNKTTKGVYGNQGGTDTNINKTVPEFSVFKGKNNEKGIKSENIEEEKIASSNEISEETANNEENAIKGFQLRDIHFDFDSAVIKPQDIPYLESLAELLQKHPQYKLVVEGHCDERGSEMYNLALGQRRADAVKKFLVNLGVNSNRIQTISYGEEKPVDPRHNEEAWAKNRRCHFVIEK